ncbi:MAG TPA: UbiA family prenyltransferase [Saprospiraceae bacterium]
MIMPLIQLIRLPNLFLIGLIQSLIYSHLLLAESSVMDWEDFFLLSIITMIVAAAGYVINDYYDAKIDRINRPQRWIAGNTWPLKKVMNTFFIISFLGGVLAVILALRLSLLAYIFVYPLAIAGLWYYSYALKCKPVLGNLWVALFCAGVVVLVALPDLLLKNSEVVKLDLWYYAAFAFLSTWYREVVKDLEDVNGDQTADCKTFVVRYGLLKGKIMAGLIALLLLVALLFWEVSYTDNTLKLLFTVMEGCIVASFAFVWWAKEATYFHRSSLMIKGIMLAGTLMLIFIK